MVNLLEKFSVRAGDAPIKLLKVIKNPVTNYLPPGCKKTLFTFKAGDVVRPSEIAKRANQGPHCVGMLKNTAFPWNYILRTGLKI